MRRFRNDRAEILEMKVLYDYQILTRQKYGGISRYYYELINQMKKNNLVEARLVCYKSKNAYFEDYFRSKPVEGYTKVGKKTVQVINRFISIFNLLFWCDVIQPTYYDDYLLRWNLRRRKIVITVYDMIHELFPDALNKKDKTVKQKKRYIYKADRIIAISESTKNDIMRIYPDIPASKIDVIYIGSCFNRKANPKVIPSLPPKYILYVGTRHTYKNFDNFARASIEVLKTHSDFEVVCAGGGPFTSYELELMGDYSKRFHNVEANDDILTKAYENAYCFVFPSLYEGFGIPTLEAFSCKCPVLLSKTSSMPEVGGDAALYFDPYDYVDIAKTILQLIDNSYLREEMIIRGSRQLDKFKWNDIAKQVYESYKKVLN